jgi:hypothetical protein
VLGHDMQQIDVRAACKNGSVDACPQDDIYMEPQARFDSVSHCQKTLQRAQAGNQNLEEPRTLVKFLRKQSLSIRAALCNNTAFVSMQRRRRILHIDNPHTGNGKLTCATTLSLSVYSVDVAKKQ